jgi:hypothetical protein
LALKSEQGNWSEKKSKIMLKRLWNWPIY